MTDQVKEAVERLTDDLSRAREDGLVLTDAPRLRTAIAELSRLSRLVEEAGGGWRDMASAPLDGSSFLALQDGEIFRAYGAVNPKTGAPYFVRRIHERNQGRTYRVMNVEIDGAVSERRVLIAEEPDDYRWNWCSWSNNFTFSPTAWAPLPRASLPHKTIKDAQ